MITVNYNFYEEYINIDNNFKEKLQIRINQIKTNNFYGYNKTLTNDEYKKIIEEYFVEIFSWSVLPYKILNIISNILQVNNCFKIIDPCCGNGFHGYLFNTFTNIKCISYDIQMEANSWSNMIEMEGIEALKNTNKHIDYCLLLSWIDYEELNIKLMDQYKGYFIISIGNYEKLSPKYISKLNKDYNNIKTICLYMPWGAREKIEIYKRK